jgi:hypothetical protein
MTNPTGRRVTANISLALDGRYSQVRRLPPPHRRYECKAGRFLAFTSNACTLIRYRRPVC